LLPIIPLPGSEIAPPWAAAPQIDGALDAANPLAFWAQVAQLTWQPWLLAARSRAQPWTLALSRGDSTSRSAQGRGSPG
jgi:hypothetical protein